MRLTNIPAGEQLSELFDIKVNGEVATAYFTRVSAMPFNCVWPGHQRPVDQTEEAPVLSFEMDAPVTIELTAKKNFDEVIVRPLSKNIKPVVDGRSITLTIEKCGQYTVELDGPHNALHIFADPEIDFGVSKDDENVIYFPAGVHHAGLITLKSNQTLYLERGAVVYGAVHAAMEENIKILGYGIIDGSWEKRDGSSVLVIQDFNRRNPDTDAYSPILRGLPIYTQDPIVGSVLVKDRDEFNAFIDKWNGLRTCIHLYSCTNVEINGVTLRDSSGFTLITANCENTVIDNIKIIGMWRYNSDGIDVFNSRDLIIRNSYLRNFDDCVVLKGIIGFDTWNMENILVENCVIWCDWGKSLEIGAETCAPEYRNITFRNCDCIHNLHMACDIASCDYAHVHDVIFDDIRVEYSRYDEKPVYQHSDDMVYTPSHGAAAVIGVGFAGEIYFCADKKKGQISDITFKNIQILTDGQTNFPPIWIGNYNAEHTVNNILIDNLTFNGEKITDLEKIEGWFADGAVVMK